MKIVDLRDILTLGRVSEKRNSFLAKVEYSALRISR